MRFFLVLISLLAICHPRASADDNVELWDQAADSYDSGEYQKAAGIYSRLLERGFVNPEVYYNLGNSYFKSGRLGASIWAYRRALKLDPGMEQAGINLDYVREFNADKIEVESGGFIQDIWSFLTGLATVNGYLLLFALAWWVSGLIASYAVIRTKTVIWPHYLLILGLSVAIFAGVASATRIRHDRFSRWGVIVSKAVDIREGPAEDFDKIEVAHEGLEFRILGERENSLLIELENGLKGWVASETVLEI
jgi:tetratricopeptide (TPR) repeat protein